MLTKPDSIAALATADVLIMSHDADRAERPADWVTRPAEAHHSGRFADEIQCLGRYPLLVIDELGYLTFDPEAANLFVQLISARYERASVIVTSNKPLSLWGDVFGGDDTVAAEDVIARLLHHTEIIDIKGDSYRLKDRGLGRTPPANTND